MSLCTPHLSYLIVLDVAVGGLQQILPLALDVLGAREPRDELGPAGARQLKVVVLDPGSGESISTRDKRCDSSLPFHALTACYPGWARQSVAQIVRTHT